MTDQQLIAQLLGAHKRIASITASKNTNALEAINEAKQIAAEAIAAAEAREGERCPHCFGSGVMPKAVILPEPPDVKCRNCNGTGRVRALLAKGDV